MKFLLPICIISIFLTACGSIKPAAPDLPPSQINSTPLPESRIDLPVTIDLSQLFNDFTAKTPAQLAGDGSAGPAQYRWNIQRQPFNLSLNGDSLNIIDAAHFKGGGYLKNPLNGKWISVCSCDADATIGIHAGFSLLNDYSLAGTARLAQFDLSACNLNVLNFNVTPIIKARAADEINKTLAGLNQKIKQYNFRALLQPAWASLYQPVKIGDIGYVLINPSAIRMSHPTGSGNTLKLTAGITAKPVFYLNNPGNQVPSVIPNISSTAGGNGFNLTVDVHLDYKPLNDLLKTAVSDKKVEAGTKGYIIIKGAEIYGSGNDHLLIRVKFTGKEGAIPYRGTLYFTCIPQYNAAIGELYVNDIDFDVNTITKLKEGPAAWIMTSGIKKNIGSQVHFNVSQQINGIKTKLNQSINGPAGPHLTLSGSVDSLSLQGILPGKDYMLVRVNTAGSLVIKIN